MPERSSRAGDNAGLGDDRVDLNPREKHFKVIARELRHEYGIRDPEGPREEADEIELVWSTHSTVFYMGIRQWIYGVPPPPDIGRTIDVLVDCFLLGAPGALKRQRGQ